MPKSFDAIIIGAGIVGPSTAYYLAHGGMRNIAIVDAFAAGGQATRAAAAMVMHQTGVKETTQLSKISIQKYANFLDELGHDIKFKKVGSVLFSTTEEGEKVLEAQAAMQKAQQVATEIWKPADIEVASQGMISSKAIRLGIYCPGDGYIDANLAVQAYLSRAKEMGATVIENTRITAIIVRRGRVVGAKTDKGDIIHSRIVVNCAGVYAKDVAQSIGIGLPIKASKKCLGVLGSESKGQPFPIIEDIDQGWYFRPHHKGIMVGFGLGEWVEDKDRQESPAFDSARAVALKQYVSTRAPSLAELPLIEKWAGYRPMIDPSLGDDLPILGPVDHIAGYYNNCGYGEFGITHASAGGELVANLILGKQTAIDTAPFLLSRFGNHRSI